MKQEDCTEASVMRTHDSNQSSHAQRELKRSAGTRAHAVPSGQAKKLMTRAAMAPASMAALPSLFACALSRSPSPIAHTPRQHAPPAVCPSNRWPHQPGAAAALSLASCPHMPKCTACLAVQSHSFDLRRPAPRPRARASKQGTHGGRGSTPAEKN